MDYDPDTSLALCTIELVRVGLVLENDGTGGITLASTSEGLVCKLLAQGFKVIAEHSGCWLGVLEVATRRP